MEHASVETGILLQILNTLMMRVFMKMMTCAGVSQNLAY
jgi:hypothetical protein